MINKLMLYSGIALGCSSSKVEDFDNVQYQVNIKEADETVSEDIQQFTFDQGGKEFSLFFTDIGNNSDLSIVEEIEVTITRDGKMQSYQLRKAATGIGATSINVKDPVIYNFHFCGENRVLCSKLIGSTLKSIAVVSFIKLEGVAFTVEYIGLSMDKHAPVDVRYFSYIRRLSTILSMAITVSDRISLSKYPDVKVTCDNITFVSDGYNALLLFSVENIEYVACIKGTIDGQVEVRCASYGFPQKIRYVITLPWRGDDYYFDVVKLSSTKGLLDTFYMKAEGSDLMIIGDKNGKRKVGVQLDESITLDFSSK